MWGGPIGGVWGGTRERAALIMDHYGRLQCSGGRGYGDAGNVSLGSWAASDGPSQADLDLTAAAGRGSGSSGGDGNGHGGSVCFVCHLVTFGAVGIRPGRTRVGR